MAYALKKTYNGNCYLKAGSAILTKSIQEQPNLFVKKLYKIVQTLTSPKKGIKEIRE